MRQFRVIQSAKQEWEAHEREFEAPDSNEWASLPHSSTLCNIKVEGGEWDNSLPLTFAIRVPAALRISTEFKEWCLEITAFNTRSSSPKRSWTTWCRQFWWSETHIKKHYSHEKKVTHFLIFWRKNPWKNMIGCEGVASVLWVVARA